MGAVVIDRGGVRGGGAQGWVRLDVKAIDGDHGGSGCGTDRAWVDSLGGDGRRDGREALFDQAGDV